MERSLMEEGVAVETISTNDNGRGEQTDVELCSPIKENGVTRRFFPKQCEFYKVSIPLGQWLKRNIGNYDLLHIHALFSYTSIVSARTARKSKVPFIVRPLGVLNHYGMTQRRAFLKRLSLHWIERPLLESAAAIHFTSEQEKLEAQSLGIPFRSAVVPLGLEWKPGDVSNLRTKDSILFLSRLDPKKNLESLLKAWASCFQEFSGWVLQIAGGGNAEYEQDLRALSVKLGIHDRVEWLGHLEGDSKEIALAEASVYVLPSYSENFGIAAAEALFAGKACIFSPGVAVGAHAVSAGAALEGGPDCDSLADALRFLLRDASKRALLGEKASSFAELELSAQSMGRRLRELYESVLEN